MFVIPPIQISEPFANTTHKCNLYAKKTNVYNRKNYTVIKLVTKKMRRTCHIEFLSYLIPYLSLFRKIYIMFM